jgi:hypothetical protein
MSSAAKEFEDFARDCVRLAERADTPDLREKLLNLAREWMRAVMDDEDSDCAAQNGRPVVTTQRRDRRSQAARPPSLHSDEVMSRGLSAARSLSARRPQRRHQRLLTSP